MNKGRVLLVAAALMALITALAHMSCIVLGPECYATQLAPTAIVESAKAGTWLAPVGTTLVSLLFVACALYALSAAQIMKALPFLSLAIKVISSLCILRGLMGLALAFIYPELTTKFAFISSWLWLLSGICFALGFKLMNKGVSVIQPESSRN